MNHSIILFDGVCNYCNMLVNFIIRNDKNDYFRFAAQQSETGQRLLKENNLSITLNDSFYMIENGIIYSHSTAGLRIAKKLPWYLKWLYVFVIIPKPIRDWMYSFIAKNRYKIWGKRNECMVPDVKIKSKFSL